MKKRILAFVLCMIMAVSAVGCSISDDVITIKKYKKLKVEKVIPAKVTDEDVDMSIQSTLQTMATRR